MARYLYGGGGDGDIIKPTGTPYLNANATVYNARSGGAQVSDLQNISGAAITSITSDAFGQVLFYGPDNFIGVLWLDFGTGVRWALSPKALDLAATRAIAVQRAADAAAPSFTARSHLPYSAADPLEQSLSTALDPLVIPRFASSSARNSAFTAPANGDRCYRTDLKADQVYDGTGWQTLGIVGGWTLDTFTITATSGTFSIGSGAIGIRYRTDGRSVVFYLWANFAADTTFGSGTWTLGGFPFTFATEAVSFAHVVGHTGSSAGRFTLTAQTSTSNRLVPYAVTSMTNTGLNQIGASPVPGGGSWGSGNFLRLSGTLELA